MRQIFLISGLDAHPGVWWCRCNAVAAFLSQSYSNWNVKTYSKFPACACGLCYQSRNVVHLSKFPVRVCAHRPGTDRQQNHTLRCTFVVIDR